MAKTSSPSGLNYLSANRGTLTFTAFPDLTITLQQVPIPTLALPSAKAPNPFVDRPVFGDKLIYSPITIMMLVQENLENYLAIHDWMRGLGAPSDKSEHKNRKVTFSDAHIVIYNSNNNPVVEYTYIDVFPVELSGIDFNEEIMETTPIKASATFEYMRYDVKVIR